ncbi:MAG: carbohydrate porin [Candidatus Gastranaerophilales bacterium]|nr:carbohydrate porin [Candidatus Gastranaerophilales bacterium]
MQIKFPGFSQLLLAYMKIKHEISRGCGEILIFWKNVIFPHLHTAILTLAFCLSIILLSNFQVFAQELPEKQELEIIELKLPDNNNLLNIADQNEKEEQNSDQSQIIDLPTFEQATISNYATKNWFGLREELAEYGISIIVNYMNNNFQKLYGGKNPTNKPVAQGLTSVALGIHTEKLVPLKGGHIYVLFQNSTGSSIDQDYVGDVQAINSFDTRPITELTEYWYRQSLFSDKLNIKFGKQDANLDLAFIGPGVKFINFAFSSTRTIPIPTFPATSGGISALIQPNKVFALRTGWFKSLDPSKSTEINSLFTGKGHFTIAEINLFPTYKRLQGKQVYGFWQDTNQIQDLANPGTFSSNFGVYAGFNPLILKENAKGEDTQGLSLVGQFGWAPQDRNPVTRTYAFGVSYQGLIPKRDNDATGIGAGFANFSKYVSGARTETALETFYLFQIKPWFFIQPDFQIVFHPGGQFKNAYVLGLRSVLTL